MNLVLRPLDFPTIRGCRSYPCSLALRMSQCTHQDPPESLLMDQLIYGDEDLHSPSFEPLPIPVQVQLSGQAARRLIILRWLVPWRDQTVMTCCLAYR